MTNEAKKPGVAGSVLVTDDKLMLKMLFETAQKGKTFEWMADQLLELGYGGDKDEDGYATTPFKPETLRGHRNRWNKMWQDAGVKGPDGKIVQIPEIKLDDKVRKRGKASRSNADIADMAALFAGFSNIDGKAEQGEELKLSDFTDQPKAENDDS